MLGPIITVGILFAVLLLVGYAIVQPRKKRRAKPARNAKKRKSVWIKIL